MNVAQVAQSFADGAKDFLLAGSHGSGGVPVALIDALSGLFERRTRNAECLCVERGDLVLGVFDKLGVE